MICVCVSTVRSFSVAPLWWPLALSVSLSASHQPAHRDTNCTSEHHSARTASQPALSDLSISQCCRSSRLTFITAARKTRIIRWHALLQGFILMLALSLELYAAFKINDERVIFMAYVICHKVICVTYSSLYASKIYKISKVIYSKDWIRHMLNYS